MGFSTLGLSDPIMQGVQAAGYTVPTPIQSLAIRPAVAGRDIIGLAQTGTGKTAAFVLPLLNTLAAGSAERGRHAPPRALVLTPTRELAQQIHKAVDTYGRFLTLRSIAVYGGVDMTKQLKLISRGVDIVIATPGRLLDHIQRHSIDLSAVRVLVLDEADRMLDMGFIRDVRNIIARVPADRQTMLFSATMPEEIESLASEVLRDPETVEAGERRNPVETIEQHFYSVQPDAKAALLVHAIEHEKMESVLVFTRTKHGADKIARRLDRARISTAAIHSNRTQGQRDRALESFKRGAIRVLVATDIAARGIDVNGISHVINLDIPQQAEDYIHRIGRTGRAGAEGDAITFITREDAQYLRRIEKYTGKHIAVRSYPGFVVQQPEPGVQAQARAHAHAPYAPRPTAQHREPSHPAQHRPASHTAPSHQAPAHQPPSHQPVTNASTQQLTAAQKSPRRHPGRPTQVSGIVVEKVYRPAGQQTGAKKKAGTARKPWEKMPPSRKKRRTPLLAAKKKAPPKKLDAFSSHTGGSGWSNY
jgi:ATP-dependent RNA helicase RhlE